MKKAILALGAVFVLISLFAGCTTARGEKIGTITKLAEQGPICPTWEGQIIRGGINGGTGAFGAPFDFTVKTQDPVRSRWEGNRDLVKEARYYMEKGIEVKLYYVSYEPTLCSSDSGHFVYALEPVDPTKKMPE